MDTDPKTAAGTPPGDSYDSEGQSNATRSFSHELIKGRYLLVSELGRGGFGVTWLATDMEAGGDVVVKILLDQRAADAWALRKFRGEMEALSRIDHPGVVGFVDFGQTEDGKPFLVMQYVPGTALRRLIPRDGMPLPRVANIIRQIGNALTAAHKAGVWHRDLKPENILIQPAGPAGEESVKLIDFGIARVQDSTDVSQNTKVSGTWAYMAPEQFHGKSTALADVYQMGVVAYEMTTGIQPFRAQTPGGFVVLQAAGLKVNPKDLRPDLPEAAQAAIVQALSLDPGARPQRACDFGDAVAAAILNAELSTADLDMASQFTPARRGVRRFPRWLGAALILIALIAASALYWIKTRPPATESVAVLPFGNRMNDQDMVYLSDGITESLIDDLSHIPTLRIRARGAVVRYAGDRVDPLAAGRELHVNRIIAGSVWRRGEELRIEAELMDVRSGTRLWGHTYSRKMSSLQDAMAEFSTEITDQLRLKLSGPLKDRLARQYAAGSEAYQDYLKGRYHLNQRRGADFDIAVRYFNRAIAKNPTYAPAYAGLASAYGLMASFGSAKLALEKSRLAAQNAIDLDGTLAESYTALASVQMQSDYKWSDAEKNFLRAIELNPNWPDTREDYALELAATGRFDEALRQILIAEDLEPGLSGLRNAHGLILYLAGRNDESLALLHVITTRTNDAPGELTAESVADLIAQNYWAKSRPADALAALELLPRNPDVRTPLFVTGYARAGQVKKAEELLMAYVVRPDTVRWYNWSSANLSVGRKTEAIGALEHAYNDRAFEIMFAAVDPMLAPLRPDPRFRALLAQMKLSSLQ